MSRESGFPWNCLDIKAFSRFVFSGSWSKVKITLLLKCQVILEFVCETTLTVLSAFGKTFKWTGWYLDTKSTQIEVGSKVLNVAGSRILLLVCINRINRNNLFRFFFLFTSSWSFDVQKKCPLCDVMFPPNYDQSKFEEHVESHWKVCPMCSEQFPPDYDQQGFERHVQTHFDQNVLNFD